MLGELKILITGSPGAGKSTAIRVISECPPVQTELATTDEIAEVKATTTAAMDFGEVTLDNDQKLNLYGTPGQERFKHMWQILSEGALGVIILLDATRKNIREDLTVYLDNFSDLIDKTSAVIGVTHVDKAPNLDMEHLYDVLAEKNRVLPVLEVDVRKQNEMLLLMRSLISSLEFA